METTTKSSQFIYAIMDRARWWCWDECLEKPIFDTCCSSFILVRSSWYSPRTGGIDGRVGKGLYSSVIWSGGFTCPLVRYWTDWWTSGERALLSVIWSGGFTRLLVWYSPLTGGGAFIVSIIWSASSFFLFGIFNWENGCLFWRANWIERKQTFVFIVWTCSRRGEWNFQTFC